MALRGIGEKQIEEAIKKEANIYKKIAKKKGILGLGKKTKIAKAGNSLVVRIPKEIADYLGLKEGKEAFVHPEEKRLVIG